MIYRFLLALVLSSFALHAQVDFTGRAVAERLNIPWDMLEGPDGKIWFTERVGLVSRVDPDTRKVDTLHGTPS
jgi:streptogramin lyase